jgi:hypothetical protein
MPYRPPGRLEGLHLLLQDVSYSINLSLRIKASSYAALSPIWEFAAKGG